MVCTHTHTPPTTTKKAPLYTTHTHIYIKILILLAKISDQIKKTKSIDIQIIHSVIIIIGAHCQKIQKKKIFFLSFFLFIISSILILKNLSINQLINQ